MADKDKMSVDDMLAALRGGKSPAKSDDAASEKVEATADTPAAETSPPPADAAPKKKPGEMSVAEMLAAARGGGGAGKTKEEPAASAPAEEAPAASTPAKKPGDMSVAEMLAAARGGGKKAEAPKPAAKKAAPKPKAKPAAAAKAEKPADAGPRDTASILAAARKANKPGPVSKSEGAAVAKKPAKAKLTAPPMPQKPAYASPAPAAAPAGENRRNFFSTLTGVFFGSSLAIGFTSLGLWHILGVLGLARYMFPNILTEPPTKFKVGFPDDFGPGQVQTKFKAQFGVWIVRSDYEGQPMIVALQSVCTHLGCTPNWLEGEQKFKCPCHGSGFYKDGINFEGPAPRPLERFAIRLADDGQLEVDKSRKFQEELGQWKDTASYVPV